MRYISLFIFVSLFNNILLGQNLIEFRNYYTNRPLIDEIITVNNEEFTLDSFGRIDVRNLSNNSIYIEFNKFAYSLQLNLENLKNDSINILHQFDKIAVIESSEYKIHKRFFGILKYYTYGPGPTEEYNSHDIFQNIDEITISRDGKHYIYILEKPNRNTLNLTIN